jgi:hypothetical protein
MTVAKILADSIGPAGVRLTTWELTYQRFIHSELMTYRKAARNAASSRAIPIEKMRRRIRRNPAMPVHWGANQAGMSARAELTGIRRWLAIRTWILGCYLALFVSWLLLKIGVHKQITNRVTEPWMHITTVFTIDEYGLANLFHQRNHPDAQPEFADLARKMWVAYNTSKPTVLQAGEWHMPLLFPEDRAEVERRWPDRALAMLKAIATGRVARTSYLTHDGKRDLAEDVKLHDRLKDAKPGHWSPFDHVCQALETKETVANFVGWKPYRKEFAEEFLTTMPEWKPADYGL